MSKSQFPINPALSLNSRIARGAAAVYGGLFLYSRTSHGKGGVNVQCRNAKKFWSLGFWHWGFRRAALRRGGMSLIEIVLYVALLGMASVFMVNSFIQIANVYARARAEREALANARAALTAITDAIASSQTAYGPTSRFNSDTGQLSLATSATSTPGEGASYIDFWVDNGRIFERIEGQGAIPLSAATARVTQFRFERIMQSLGREGVKITIRVDAAGTKFPASVTLNATTALRGNY